MKYIVKRYSIFGKPRILRKIEESQPGNAKVLEADVQNGNYLDAVKHAFYVPKETRVAYKEGVYSENEIYNPLTYQFKKNKWMRRNLGIKF